MWRLKIPGSLMEFFVRGGNPTLKRKVASYIVLTERCPAKHVKEEPFRMPLRGLTPKRTRFGTIYVRRVLDRLFYVHRAVKFINDSEWGDFNAETVEDVDQAEGNAVEDAPDTADGSGVVDNAADAAHAAEAGENADEAEEDATCDAASTVDGPDVKENAANATRVADATDTVGATQVSDATDALSVEPCTEPTDVSDAADATDESDAIDSTVATGATARDDETDAIGLADATEAIDATDGADTTGATSGDDATDGADTGSDNDDGTDAIGLADATEAIDTTDGTDATDGADAKGATSGDDATDGADTGSDDDDDDDAFYDAVAYLDAQLQVGAHVSYFPRWARSLRPDLRRDSSHHQRDGSDAVEQREPGEGGEETPGADADDEATRGETDDSAEARPAVMATDETQRHDDSTDVTAMWLISFSQCRIYVPLSSDVLHSTIRCCLEDQSLVVDPVETVNIPTDLSAMGLSVAVTELGLFLANSKVKQKWLDHIKCYVSAVTKMDATSFNTDSPSDSVNEASVDSHPLPEWGNRGRVRRPAGHQGTGDPGTGHQGLVHAIYVGTLEKELLGNRQGESTDENDGENRPESNGENVPGNHGGSVPGSEHDENQSGNEHDGDPLGDGLDETLERPQTAPRGETLRNGWRHNHRTGGWCQEWCTKRLLAFECHGGFTLYVEPQDRDLCASLEHLLLKWGAEYSCSEVEPTMGLFLDELDPLGTEGGTLYVPPDTNEEFRRDMRMKLNAALRLITEERQPDDPEETITDVDLSEEMEEAWVITFRLEPFRSRKRVYVPKAHVRPEVGAAVVEAIESLARARASWHCEVHVEETWVPVDRAGLDVDELRVTLDGVDVTILVSENMPIYMRRRMRDSLACLSSSGTDEWTGQRVCMLRHHHHLNPRSEKQNDGEANRGWWNNDQVDTEFLKKSEARMKHFVEAWPIHQAQTNQEESGQGSGEGDQGRRSRRSRRSGRRSGRRPDQKRPEDSGRSDRTPSGSKAEKSISDPRTAGRMSGRSRPSRSDSTRSSMSGDPQRKPVSRPTQAPPPPPELPAPPPLPENAMKSSSQPCSSKEPRVEETHTSEAAILEAKVPAPSPRNSAEGRTNARDQSAIKEVHTGRAGDPAPEGGARGAAPHAPGDATVDRQQVDCLECKSVDSLQFANILEAVFGSSPKSHNKKLFSAKPNAVTTLRLFCRNQNGHWLHSDVSRVHKFCHVGPLIRLCL